MSDLDRKDFSTKAKEELTPDNSKSVFQQATETLTDATDRVAGALNPDSNKSTTQSAFDKTRREKDAHTEGPLDKTKNALGL
ncbi:putative chaperone/heat shock protein Hsp12 [Morchella snyderi]|nr:putative chaperone/heat shock protein Hsp12 [Morchella snyderi]